MIPLDRSDVAACRALLANGSRTFLAGSRLLPFAVAEAATVLYAFCRVADDAIDSSLASADTLAGLHARLDRIYRQEPDACPVDRAMAAVVQRHRISRELLDALLEGFEWDIAGRRYETLDELYAYAARVAGAVGAMMALIMGHNEARVVARAVDLGIAMQFSNIARDVGEDARCGRVYLPTAWFTRAGLDLEGWLKNPVYCTPIAEMVAQLLNEAEMLYQRGRTGIGQLPIKCQPAIFAVAELYAEIGHQVQRQGCNSIASRARVPARRKLVLCLAAISKVAVRPGLATSLPHPASQFLIDAAYRSAASEVLGDARLQPAPWYRLDRQLEDLFCLFLKLEERDASVRLASTLRHRA